MTSTGRSGPQRSRKSSFWASVSTTMRSAARIVSSDTALHRLVMGPFAISDRVGDRVASADRWARWTTYTLATRGLRILARYG